MSIKQNGGVFGRNPYFNTVSADALVSAMGGMTVTGGPLTVTDQGVVFQGSGNNNTVSWSPATKRLGVGLTSPARKFEVLEESSAIVAQFRSGTGGSAITLANSGSTADQIRIGSSGSSLYFSTWYAQRLTIAGGPGSTGDVTINTGNLVIGTSGKGIDFSATSGTGTSELFDDYEEGTWTPTIAGQSSGGTGTYTSQSGGYRKVGGMVQAWFQVGISAHTGAGVIDIEGFPFTSANDGLAQVGTAATLDMTYTAAGVPVIRMTANSAKANLYTITSGASWTAQSLATDTVFTIYGSICYKTT
jgi:hypothetical protein